MQKDLFTHDLPIHIIDWKAFKNKFWFVLRGDQKIAYISHNIDGSYWYNDLTQKLLKRKRYKLNASDFYQAEKETRELLAQPKDHNDQS